jgi:hypothetical protein
VVVHGDAALPDDARVVVLADGSVGMGTSSPVEKLHVNGAMIVGNTTNASPVEGTIRWNGSDFEGRTSFEWRQLSGPFKRTGSHVVHFDTVPGPLVGIGIDAPQATVHVKAKSLNSSVPFEARCAFFENTSTAGTLPADAHRVGLQIANSGTWNNGPASHDIGLYVSGVSGASSANSNLAAVLNGNVVLGDVGGDEVGASGNRVLVIQNGTAPSAPPSSGSGLPDGGVQMYSSMDVSGTSVLHVMNGDGSVIQLRKGNPLFTGNNDTVSPVYDASVMAIIDNMRTRINELESRLQTIGLLP